jgi:hypothetical protein
VSRTPFLCGNSGYKTGPGADQLPSRRLGICHFRTCGCEVLAAQKLAKIIVLVVDKLWRVWNYCEEAKKETN